jgi:hypothetical protein
MKTRFWNNLACGHILTGIVVTLVSPSVVAAAPVPPPLADRPIGYAADGGPIIGGAGGEW